MTHPGHQFPGIRTCVGDELVAGVPQMWRDVAAQQPAIDGDRLGTKASAFINSDRAVVGHEHRARVRINPFALDQLGFLAGEPGLSFGLGGEGVVGRADDAVRAGRRGSDRIRTAVGWIEVLSDLSKGLDGGPVFGIRDAIEHDGPMSSDFAFQGL